MFVARRVAWVRLIALFNTMMENIMKTLKAEGVYPMAFESEEDVAHHLTRFIDSDNEEAPVLSPPVI